MTNKEPSTCPDCPIHGLPDDIAIHLIDTHGWETDKATVWLREQVEERSFYANA